MARVSDVTIIRQPAMLLLGIRRTIRFPDGFSDLTEEGFEGTLALLAQQGEAPASGAVVCFHNEDLEALDVEAGFLVEKPLPVSGSLGLRAVPSCRFASAIDRGPYEASDGTLQDIYAFIEAAGLRAGDSPVFYHYLNQPAWPAEEMLTRMAVPLRD